MIPPTFLIFVGFGFEVHAYTEKKNLLNHTASFSLASKL